MKNYPGENQSDLTFRVGEKILIETKISGSSWLFGSIGNRSGWFPGSAVKIEEHYI